MILKPSIIVRDEGNHRWLYNGANGALVSVEQSAYHNLVALDDTRYPALREWLRDSDFLADSPGSVDADRDRCRSSHPLEATTGFYDLRSRLAPLNILWAITPRCNLRCVYCFPDAPSHHRIFEEASGAELLAVADEIIEAKVFKVTLSGGECLLSPHLWSIVHALKAAGLTVSVLSNGTDIGERTLECLRETRIQVGISLDGPDEAINGLTRGPGSFGRTLRALERLFADGIPTSVLVTLTRHNFDRLEDHIALLSHLGAKIIVLQDLRFFGSREIYDATRMTAEQERDLERKLALIISRYPDIAFNTTELLMFFHGQACGTIMPCPAGDNFGYIDFYGDFYPCTSLPSFKMGNLFGDESIVDLWQRSEAILELRRIKSLSVDCIPGCAACPNRSRCGSGCRGDALFYEDSIFGLPSRCPRRMGLLIDA